MACWWPHLSIFFFIPIFISILSKINLYYFLSSDLDCFSSPKYWIFRVPYKAKEIMLDCVKDNKDVCLLETRFLNALIYQRGMKYFNRCDSFYCVTLVSPINLPPSAPFFLPFISSHSFSNLCLLWTPNFPLHLIYLFLLHTAQYWTCSEH